MIKIVFHTIFNIRVDMVIRFQQSGNVNAAIFVSVMKLLPNFQRLSLSTRFLMTTTLDLFVLNFKFYLPANFADISSKVLRSYSDSTISVMSSPNKSAFINCDATRIPTFESFNIQTKKYTTLFDTIIPIEPFSFKFTKQDPIFDATIKIMQ